ncbi:hypothetical protein PJ985_00555 [Streptomyces sp. ACA25]|uniref:hypothetical protein n=1 Tax=Streptomyces sp. ACA25 TaxID=3022596 RepID=UPI0023076474|nr:hypothetical protein [Streptomyces sp. ACA25]MDB1086073.1 hypothetical protein [Streptomyces sp. ACA25]
MSQSMTLHIDDLGALTEDSEGLLPGTTEAVLATPAAVTLALAVAAYTAASCGSEIQ